MSTYSIVSQPDFLEPVYQNTIPYVVNSTNNTLTNFRYRFNVFTSEIYPQGFVFRSTLVTYPRTNGDCIFSPHYILKDNLTFNNTPFINDFQLATQSLLYYKINFGESYNPEVNFVDTQSTTGSLTLIFTYSPGLTFSDIIRVDKDDKTVNSDYDGTHSILNITNTGATYFVTTNTTFGTTVSNESGYIIDVERDLTQTTGTKSVFNATEQYDEIGTDYTQYIGATSSPGKFLNVWTGEKSLYFDSVTYSSNLRPGLENYNSFETLSFIIGTAINQYTGSGDYRIQLKIETFTPATPSTPFETNVSISLTASNTQTERIDIPAGIGNLLNTGLNWGPVDKYNLTLNLQLVIGIITLDLGAISETRSYKLITQCREYPLYTISFLNKLGGFDYAHFHLVSKYRSQIQRNIIEKVLRYNYKIKDRGQMVIDQKITEEWTIESDWLRDDEALFIRELIESPEVYLLDGSNQLPIIITDNQYEYKSNLNDLQIQYTIRFRKAYDIISNI